MTMVDPSRLNPYVDPAQWGFVDLGGLRLPGVVQSIDGASKPEEWQVQKATAKSGASTVWKGTRLAEAIKIVMALPNADAFDAYYAVRDALRPKLGTNPPALLIVNPAINFSGITRVACVDVGPPKWVPAGGYWTGEVTLIEYNPSKPANVGPPKPKNSNSTGGGAKSDPNQAIKDEIQTILDQQAKGGA